MADENIKIIDFGFVNAFLVKAGDGFILIDTGWPSQWKKIEKELISAGALPDKIKLAIVTHGDPDHSGNCIRLQEKYGVKIAMHKDDLSTIERRFPVEREVTSAYMKIIFFIFYLLAKVKGEKANVNKFQPDIFLEDGQNLQEYGFAAKVIHVPGHTKGSIAVLTENGDLFAGDTFINIKTPKTANAIENDGEFKQSLEKIKRLNIKMIYPGHGKPFLMESLK